MAGLRNQPGLAYCAIPLMSMTTTGSSPSTQSSWPGGNQDTSPGPNSISLPSPIATWSRPDTWYSTCTASQLLVLTTGLTDVDQRQPGCNVARPNVTPLTVTSSTPPCGNARVSSGWAKFFFCICATGFLLAGTAARSSRVMRLSYVRASFTTHGGLPRRAPFWPSNLAKTSPWPGKQQRSLSAAMGRLFRAHQLSPSRLRADPAQGPANHFSTRRDVLGASTFGQGGLRGRGGCTDLSERFRSHIADILVRARQGAGQGGHRRSADLDQGRR